MTTDDDDIQIDMHKNARGTKNAKNHKNETVLSCGVAVVRFWARLLHAITGFMSSSIDIEWLNIGELAGELIEGSCDLVGISERRFDRNDTCIKRV